MRQADVLDRLGRHEEIPALLIPLRATETIAATLNDISAAINKGARAVPLLS